MVVMIRQIQCRRFNGQRASLTIQGLRSGLNVIRMPDWESARELADRIFRLLQPDEDRTTKQDTLLGVIDRRSTRAPANDAIDYGPAIAAQLLDWLPDDKRTIANARRLAELLATDRLPSETFPNACVDLGLEALMNGTEAIQVPMERTVPKPDAESLAEPVAELGKKRSEYFDHLKAIRAQYVGLCQRQSELQSQSDFLVTESDRLSRKTHVLELACDAAEKWTPIITNDRTESTTITIGPLQAVRSEIESIDLQIQQTRRRLQKIRNSDVRSSRVVQPPADDDRLQRIAKLLDDRKNWEATERAVEQLREAIRTESTGPPRPERRSARAMLERLRPYAKEIRSTRLRLRQLKHQLKQFETARAKTDTALLPAGEGVEFPQEVSKCTDQNPLGVIAISDLCHQVDVLKRECAQLLARRSLSYRALLSIGAVSALGLALILAGSVLDLRGNEWTSVMVGLTFVFSAVVLKITCERPPDEALRFHRHRMSALLQQINELKAHPQSDSLSEGEKDRSLLQQIQEARRQRRKAIAAWRAALRREGLPLSDSPRQLLARLSEAWQPRSADSASDLRLQGLRHSLQNLVSGLSAWKQSASHLLGIDLATSPSMSVDSIARLASEQIQCHAAGGSSSSITIGPADKPGAAGKAGRMQSRLLDLKKQKQKLLQEIGLRSSDELNQRIDDETQRASMTNSRRLQQAELMNRLRESGFEAEVQDLISRHSAAELRAVLSEAQEESRGCGQGLLDNKRQLHEVEQRLEALIGDSTVQKQGIEYAESTAEVRRLARELICRIIAWHATAKAKAEPPAIDSRVFKIATKFFRVASGWRTASIVPSRRPESLLSVQRKATATPWHELPHAIRILAGICLQLATVVELAQTGGVMLPLVLTGRWTQLRNRSSRNIARLLGRMPKSIQVLVIVGDDAAAEPYLGRRASILRVDRRERTRSRDSRSIASRDALRESDHRRHDVATEVLEQTRRQTHEPTIVEFDE
jgi:hypothetical protein